MTKQTYYVSVASSVILDEQARKQQPNFAYEFTVNATDDEATELKRLLDTQDEEMDKTFARAPVPYKSADRDGATEAYNSRFLELYTQLYRLGTEETRTHIERMGILEKLQNTDYELPGYGTKHDAEEVIFYTGGEEQTNQQQGQHRGPLPETTKERR